MAILPSSARPSFYRRFKLDEPDSPQQALLDRMPHLRAFGRERTRTLTYFQPCRPGTLFDARVTTSGIRWGRCTLL